MKELSIEEKAKAYDEVREKIAIRFGSNVADEIFSQFEMSEDEKIRKWLIGYFKQYIIDGMPQVFGNGLNVKDVIAWLEKQSKASKVEEAMREVEEKAKAFTDAHKGETSEEILAQMRGEQKPAWSVDDDRIVRNIEVYLSYAKGKREVTEALWKEAYNWINTLKDRCVPQLHWKPSKEQMHYLSWIANIKLGDGVVEQEVSKHLNELLEDLKKLRKE